MSFLRLHILFYSSLLLFHSLFYVRQKFNECLRRKPRFRVMMITDHSECFNDDVPSTRHGDKVLNNRKLQYFRKRDRLLIVSSCDN